MLSTRDKKEIRRLFVEEFAKAFTRTIQLERGPRKQGDPQEKRVVEEVWNLIDFIAGYMPYLEGALRGMQEAVDLAKNDVALNTARIEAIGKTLLDLQAPLLGVADLSDRIKQIPNINHRHPEIEFIDESGS